MFDYYILYILIVYFRVLTKHVKDHKEEIDKLKLTNRFVVMLHVILKVKANTITHRFVILLHVILKVKVNK